MTNVEAIQKLEERISSIREDLQPFDNDAYYANGLEEALVHWKRIDDSFSCGVVDGMSILMEPEND